MSQSDLGGPAQAMKPPVSTQATPEFTVQRLRKGSVGTIGVVFMAVATSAPITAMVGNVPVSVGSGNGWAAPAGYLIATVVLGLFGLGYAAMAKHLTSTGAFYGYISHGLGRVLGLASGVAITMAYVVFSASLVGIFAYFTRNTMASLFGVHLHWAVYAAVMIVACGVLSYFDISIASKVLGVLLVLEILMLTLGAVAVAVHGGGPQGFHAASINPVNAFKPAQGVAGASAGLGLFFAFWSWVGFESTAMYGEESRDPKRIIPRATMVAVLGVGIFYVLVSWMAISGTGPMQAIKLAQNPDTSSEIFFGPVRHYYASWAIDVFNVLLVTGSFACGLAFHNCASRYLYAIAREGIIPAAHRTLGRTHERHGSPHVAALAQTVLTAVIVAGFLVTGQDPYADMYVLLALIGTAAIMIVQALCAFAVIGYFHVQKQHPETRNWFTTLLAPALGGVAMIYVVYLLWKFKDAAAGTASSSPLLTALPWIVLGSFVVGAVIALWVRARDRETYERIGRVHLDSAN